MKNILITGGSGFLAGKIYDHLKSDFNVVLGTRDTIKLADYPKKNVGYFNIDDPLSYNSSLSGIDGVIHLAAMDFQDCEKNPELAWKINVERVKELLESCHHNAIPTFIYMSTIHVYGSDLAGEIAEETPVNPANTYSKTHLKAEELVLKDSQLRGIVVRLSNSIGRPLHPDSPTWKLVVNDLCQQAVKCNKIVLQSSGLQSRDFVPASAVGPALQILLEKGKAGEIYQLGWGQSLTILEIAAKIQNKCQELFNHRPELLTKAPQNEKVTLFTYSLSKLKQLGFSHSHQLEDEITDILLGIASTIRK